MHFITKTFNPDKGYSCVFRQQHAASHCHLAHGYDLQFSITLGAKKLDANGWVYDFAGLKPIEQIIKETFDHKTVIAFDDEARDVFELLERRGACSLTVLTHVGCEAFATWLMQVVDAHLRETGDSQRVALISTTVSEHGANLAGWVNPKFAGMVGIA